MNVFKMAKQVCDNLLSIEWDLQGCSVIIFNGNVGYEYTKIICNFVQKGVKLLNNSRGYFDHRFFVHDEDTVVAWDGENVVFWHEERLSFMSINENAFDIYLRNDIPYIEHKGIISEPVFCERPCSKWVEPVYDKYIVFPVVNDTGFRPIGASVSCYLDIGSVIYKQGGNIIRDTLLLESMYEKLMMSYTDFQKALKLGILSKDNLMGVDCEQGVRLVPSRYLWQNISLDWGSVIVRDGVIWRDGIVARLHDTSHVFVNTGGDLVVSNTTCKYDIPKNLFLRSLL